LVPARPGSPHRGRTVEEKASRAFPHDVATPLPSGSGASGAPPPPLLPPPPPPGWYPSPAPPRSDSQIVVIVVVVVAVVVLASTALAFVLYFEVAGIAPGGFHVPLGTSHWIESPTETIGSGHAWYNFTVGAAAPGLQWGDLSLTVQAATGSTLMAPGATTVVLSYGAPVASYDLSGATWTSGGSASVLMGQVLSVDTLGAHASGGTLLVSPISSSYTGNIQVNIP